MDLNTDLGESFGRWTLGDDAAMLGIVTSANVACGFHAGDPTTLRRTCALAAAARGRRRRPGRLPGPGRVRPPVHRRRARPSWPTTCSTRSARWRRSPGGRHRGALRQAARRAVQRDRAPRASRPRPWSTAVRDYDPTLPVLGLPGSACSRRRRRRPAHRAGGFADRGYTAEGTLVPRDRDGPCCTIPARSPRGWCGWSTDGVVVAVDGSVVPVAAESLCVHGDTPGAVEMAGAVRAGLRARPGCSRRRSRRSRPGDGVEGGADDGAAGRRRRAAGRGGRAAGGARRWPTRCARRRCPGCVDVVPAARTVLLVPGPRHRPRDDPSRGARPAGRTPTPRPPRSDVVRDRRCATTARTWPRSPG